MDCSVYLILLHIAANRFVHSLWQSFTS